MTTKNGLSDSGVSRRDMMRFGAGGLGFCLFGGIGPVPQVLGEASLAAAAMTVHPAIRVMANVTVRRIYSFAIANYSNQRIVGDTRGMRQAGRW